MFGAAKINYGAVKLYSFFFYIKEGQSKKKEKKMAKVQKEKKRGPK
jgi:hypothetical protein